MTRFIPPKRKPSDKSKRKAIAKKAVAKPKAEK
jgi:hypothetical protein